MKVVVKPTTYKADEVRLRALAKGGLSILPDEEFYMGEMMPAVNSMSGVGKFSATELKKQLSGKSASVQTSVENYASVMNGVCSPKDLETMFQLLWLNFTQPRFDENDYNTLMNMLRTQLENAKSNPDYTMMEVFTDEAYGHNPRRQMISLEHLDQFSFEALPGIYRKLYPDANSFLFTIVGQRGPRDAASAGREVHRLAARLEEGHGGCRGQLLPRKGRCREGLYHADAAAEGFGALPLLG